MLDIARFTLELRESGTHLFSGVPCSFLKPLINEAISTTHYVAATNEGEAVAIAAGAALAGSGGAVLLQNSGLTNALAPLTSLTNIFDIPVLGFCSLRGEPGLKDEPQHELLGTITERLLETCGVYTILLDPEESTARKQAAEAQTIMRERRKPVFFIVRDGTFSKAVLRAAPQAVRAPSIFVESDRRSERPTRFDALQVIATHRDDRTALLATTGKTGRELCVVGDSPQHFCMVGSMGCVSSVALGAAIAKPKKRFIAVDGDGAVLMRMGSLATNAWYAPTNLLHIILDNESHDSTGGQRTASSLADLALIAHAAGYPRVVRAHSLTDLDQTLRAWGDAPELTCVVLKVAHGSIDPLPRPTVGPKAAGLRFMEFLAS